MRIIDGNHEMAYQMTMAYAADMLREGLLTKKEYRDFEQEMLKKYNPLIGELFSNIDLI